MDQAKLLLEIDKAIESINQQIMEIATQFAATHDLPNPTSREECLILLDWANNGEN